MRPDVERILAKLSKEKIDLTAAGDASKLISITNQLMKKIDKDGDIYLKLYRNIQDNGDKLMEYFDLMNRTEKKLIPVFFNFSIFSKIIRFFSGEIAG